MQEPEYPFLGNWGKDGESEYQSHFSQSPLVFPEIKGVNSGSDCFGVLDRLTLELSETQFIVYSFISDA